MADLFSFENLLTLLMLIVLQAVLGFDNLLYISLESKRAPADKQSYVRKVGISIAIVLRLVLLFILVKVMSYFVEPFAHIHWGEALKAAPSIESLIVLFGGAFIVYTAIKEIWHMIGKPDVDSDMGDDSNKASTGKTIAMIILMNLVFSFDSILSAMALTDNFIVMATAVVISGIMMIWLSDNVSNFLTKNRMYEVLGLFILLIVGVMLISEGGHKAELVFWGNHVTPMSKTTFYFVIIILVLTDIVQSAYQKRLMKNQSKNGQ